MLPVRAVPAWSRAVLGPCTPTFCLATGFMIYQDQTNQGRSWGELKPVLDSFCVTWQMWDAAIRHFVLADEAVSYLGKQGCCFLAGNPLQEQKRFSVVGFCVVLEIMRCWSGANCSVARVTSFSVGLFFPVWFCFHVCVCLFSYPTEKWLTLHHQSYEEKPNAVCIGDKLNKSTFF